MGDWRDRIEVRRARARLNHALAAIDSAARGECLWGDGFRCRCPNCDGRRLRAAAKDALR